MKMKHVSGKHILAVLFMMVLFLGGQAIAGEKQVVEKTFDAKDVLKLHTVSGDCKIEASGSKIKVSLVYTFDKEYFTPIMEVEGNTLLLKEKFKKSWDWKGRHKGMSKWTVTVPAGTKIDFASASGDASIMGVKKQISAKAASGDITINDCSGGLDIKSASGDLKVDKASGDMSVKTASGDIEMDDVTGSFKVKSASGDIEVKGVAFTGESEIEAVSGEVEVVLAKANSYSLHLGTVSGDIVLDYNGNPVKGTFTFKAMKNNIKSDVSFDETEGGKYNPFTTKIIDKGGSPRITVKTVSGDVSFKK